MRILLAAIFLSPASLAAQTIAFLDKPYSEVPALAALQAVESGLPLQSKAGAPNGKIWLFETADGIQIVGAIDGPAPAYARSEPEFVSRDYIQVRLSLIDGKPEFDPGGLAEEDCDSSDANYALLCRQRAQAGRDAVKYLPNLFVRQWRFAPGIASETYAKLALRGRGSDFDAVRPKPRAGMMIADQSRFLITLAWQDFPLTDKLKISNIRLGVEFCPKGFGAGSADGPADPLQGLREFVLSRPRQYHITECNYTLNADSPPLQIENRSFYQPGPSTLVDTTFGAFQTELDAGDGGRTPTEIESTGFAAMRIGPGEFYCNGGTYLSGTKRFALSAADAKALMDSLAGELNTHDIHNLPAGLTW